MRHRLPQRVTAFGVIATLHVWLGFVAWHVAVSRPLAHADPLMVELTLPTMPQPTEPRLHAPRIDPPPVYVSQPLLEFSDSDAITVVPASPAAAPALRAAARSESTPIELHDELALACPERVAPAYPAAARRLRETGTVVLRVLLDNTGRVSDVEIAQSSRSHTLDEAAIAAVRRWQCRPAMQNGTAVPAVALQPFEFSLRRQHP